jgi:diguanylate cyclase (GGDEF)-like protein
MFPEFNNDMSANLVMMMRADVDGAIWLVDDDEEGRFYETAANDRGRVVPAFGSAGAVLDLVTERGLEGVFAVVRAPKEEGDAPAVFRPDVGDVASMLLTARSADRVLGEIGGAAWLSAAGRDIGGILPRAILIARRLEHLLGGNPVTDERVAVTIDWQAADVNWDLGAHILGATSEGVISTAKEIVATEDPASGLISCDGMSAVRVLAAATASYRPRGIPAYRSVSSNELLSLLRASYDPEQIEQDGLFWRLKTWEWRHARYLVFKSWRKREPFNVLLDRRYLDGDVATLCQAGRPFALLQLDLDHFKCVNDQLGHIDGDEAIQMAEKILLDSLRGHGEAYRRGGDELVAVRIGVSAQQAAEWAEAVRSEVERLFVAWGTKRSLVPSPTASIGVVRVSNQCSAADLLTRLEAAQLEAKRGGRNRVVSVTM